MTMPPGFSPTDFLISPPLTSPFKHRGGVSSFGVRRWRSQPSPVTGFSGPVPSTHEGIDLQPALASDDGAVYAAFWGEVVHIGQDFDGGTLKQETVTLRCDPPATGILFRYYHILRSTTLASGPASSGLSAGDRVRSGQLLGFISPNNDDPHLHFEMRLFADTTLNFADIVPLETFAIDPTQMLYRFDANRWPRARDQEAFESWDLGGYTKISRMRVLPWRVQHSSGGITFHTTHLQEIVIEQAPRGGTHISFLPIDTATAHEKELLAQLRDAFTHNMRVRLRGRHSHFFGPRMMIEDLRIRH